MSAIVLSSLFDSFYSSESIELFICWVQRSWFVESYDVSVIYGFLYHERISLGFGFDSGQNHKTSPTLLAGEIKLSNCSNLAGVGLKFPHSSMKVFSICYQPFNYSKTVFIIGIVSYNCP